MNEIPDPYDDLIDDLDTMALLDLIALRGIETRRVSAAVGQICDAKAILGGYITEARA